MDLLVVVALEDGYAGPWWCPSCSRASDATLSTVNGEPACPWPHCGAALEPLGVGDDDPDA